MNKKVTFALIGLFLLNIITLGLFIYDEFLEEDDEPEAIKNSEESEENTYGVYQVFHYDIPKKMDFSGEAVPLENLYVYELLDAEFSKYLYLHSKTSLSMKRANRWFPMIEPILKKNGIPDDFKYIAVVESSLTNAISPKKAKGFWQFLRGTGAELGLEINAEVDERYHPIKATEAACLYFKDAYRKFGNWTNAAASYNMGMRGLRNDLEAQNVSSFYDAFLNPETGKYIYATLAVKYIFSNPEKYGYTLDSAALYHPIDFKEIEVKESIPDLVSYAQNLGITYAILKTYNPWLLSNKLTIKGEGKTYTLLIPKVYFEKNNLMSSFNLQKDSVKNETDSLVKDTVQ